MRKISAYSILLLGVLVLFSMSTPVNDMQIITAKKYSKSIEKNFPISAKGEVVIINQYGNLDINTWNKNEVQFKVEIVVNATSESVAEDVFEAISVEFEGNKSLVRAETVIEEKKRLLVELGQKHQERF
jgi:acylphosphatase